MTPKNIHMGDLSGVLSICKNKQKVVTTLKTTLLGNQLSNTSKLRKS